MMQVPGNRAILLVGRNNGSDVRILKILRTLRDSEPRSLTYIGSGIAPDSPVRTIPGVRVVSARATGEGKARKISSIASLTITSIREIWRARPDVTIGINEEMAVPLIVASTVVKKAAVLELFDSWFLKRRQRRSNRLEKLVRWLFGILYRSCDAIVVTDRHRMELMSGILRNRPVYVIPNYPVRHSIRPDWQADDTLSIFVSGTLSSARGLATIVEAVQGARSRWRVVSCGWIYDDQAREFVRAQVVDYKGVLTPQETMRLASSCRLSYVVYEPKTLNNVYASPNRLYDAMSLGMPVIVNREAVHVAEFVSVHDMGYAVAFGDVDELRACLDRFGQDTERWAARSESLRREQEAKFNWEHQCAPVYHQLLASVSPVPRVE